MPSIPARPLFLLDPLDTSRNGRQLLLIPPSTAIIRDSSDNDSDTSTRTSSPRSCPQSPPAMSIFQQAKLQQQQETSTTDHQEAPKDPQELYLPEAAPLTKDSSCEEEDDDDSTSSSTISNSSSFAVAPSHEASNDESSAVREDPTKQQRENEHDESEHTVETLSNSSFGTTHDSLGKLETTPLSPIGGVEESKEEQEEEDSEDESSNTSSNSCLRKKKIKHNVVFKALSTLYVFEDEDEYDSRDTWYSSSDLKAFRADAFLTVNWMVMTGLEPGIAEEETAQEEVEIDHQPSCSIGPLGGGSAATIVKKKDQAYNYCYYSNKYGYDRQKELRRIAQQHKHQLRTMGDYEFCPRGIECRTPMGRILKNKRRVEANKVVMLYQQMQRQHRRERKRALRRRQQALYHRRELDDIMDLETSNHRRRRASLGSVADQEQVKNIEAAIDAESLASVYGSYCRESEHEALERGRADAVEAGMCPALIGGGDDSTLASATTNSTADTLPAGSNHRSRSQRDYSNRTGGEIAALVEPPSLCDEEDEEDDEFMDNLVSVSFVDHNGDDESDADSETSVSLADLLFGPDEDDSKPHLGSSSCQEVESSEVEIEFVEGDEDMPHRIYCSNDASSKSLNNNNNNANPTTTSKSNVSDAARRRNRRRPTRSMSWSPPALSVALTRSSSSPSSPTSTKKVVTPAQYSSPKPSHSSFSSLELGGLFDWW